MTTRIPLYANTKIYVACPAQTATGGPELLQQLVYHLRHALHCDAFMYYYPSTHPQPIHDDYHVYDNPYVRDIDDHQNNILIVPESKPTLALLAPFSHIRKVIWWLSVDNYYLSHFLSSKRNSFLKRSINKLRTLSGHSDLFEIRLTPSMEKKYAPLDNTLVCSAHYHLTNSHRGVDHLKHKGLHPVLYLSEYLNEVFLQLATNLEAKENIIAYNPKKGITFTRKLMRAAPDLTFVPIENLDRQGVIDLLARAKVYIDFGNHPGKDRLPREAAILECCVITGRRGSAGHPRDVRIPEGYKFDDIPSSVPAIVTTIRGCLSDYPLKRQDFDTYREAIWEEPSQFINDLKAIFHHV